jgi:hypothetical protein
MARRNGRLSAPGAAKDCYTETLFPVPKATLQHQMQRTCRKLGLEGLSIHSFRHTFGTRLGEAGASAHVIRQLMGHSTITVSQRKRRPSWRLPALGRRIQVRPAKASFTFSRTALLRLGFTGSPCWIVGRWQRSRNSGRANSRKCQWAWCARQASNRDSEGTD